LNLLAIKSPPSGVELLDDKRSFSSALDCRLSKVGHLFNPV